MRVLWLVPCALLGAAFGALLGQILAVYVFGRWMPWSVPPHAYFAPAYAHQGFLLGVMTVLGAEAGAALPLWWLKVRDRRRLAGAATASPVEAAGGVWPPAPTTRV